MGENKTTRRIQDDAQMHKVKMSSHLFFLLIKIVLLRFMILHRNGFHTYGNLVLPNTHLVIHNFRFSADVVGKSNTALV